MNTLFALVYPSKAEAEAGLVRVRDLEKGQVITVLDAVIASRSDDGGVQLEQNLNTVAWGAAAGAFWGALIGTIFLAPLAGLAAGAAAGALGGYATDYGIDDDFVRGLSQRLRPGDSALFVLAAEMTEERVAAALGPQAGEIFYTSMSPDVEARFRTSFEHQHAPPSDAHAAPVDPDAPPHAAVPLDH
jgi:uncharacterized membrane protein